jgi:hypothetical protein
VGRGSPEAGESFTFTLCLQYACFCGRRNCSFTSIHGQQTQLLHWAIKGGKKGMGKVSESLELDGDFQGFKENPKFGQKDLLFLLMSSC